jgi:hypothetical protein
MSQPANGLGIDTIVSGLRVNDPAVDGAAVTSVNAPVRARSRITVRVDMAVSS